MIEVVLIDDQQLVRGGIRLLLEETRRIRVLGDFPFTSDTARKCASLNPAVIVIDLALPGFTFLDSISALSRGCPASRILILSACDDEQAVLAAIRAGAAGYVLKYASLEELVLAIHHVAEGRVYLSPEVARCVFDRLKSRSRPGEGRPAFLGHLTNREREVLRLITRGLTNKEVALELHLSPETVRSYRKSLMAKLGVRNVAGLTQAAIRGGLVSLAPSPAWVHPEPVNKSSE
jgi:DNA-binding NarL/FixJ family response regulator